MRRSLSWTATALHTLPLESVFLIIFVKNPIAGKVKTRIARTMGDDEALRIYRILLEMAKATALGVDAQRLLCYSDEVIEDDAWSPLFLKKKSRRTGTSDNAWPPPLREPLRWAPKKR